MPHRRRILRPSIRCLKSGRQKVKTSPREKIKATAARESLDSLAGRIEAVKFWFMGRGVYRKWLRKAKTPVFFLARGKTRKSAQKALLTFSVQFIQRWIFSFVPLDLMLMPSFWDGLFRSQPWKKENVYFEAVAVTFCRLGSLLELDR